MDDVSSPSSAETILEGMSACGWCDLSTKAPLKDFEMTPLMRCTPSTRWSPSGRWTRFIPMTERPDHAWAILPDTAASAAGIAGARGPEGAPGPAEAICRYSHRTAFTVHDGEGRTVGTGMLFHEDPEPSEAELESPIHGIFGLLEEAGVPEPYEIGWPTL